MLARIRSGPITLGRMCTSRTRGAPAPSERSARMNSVWRSERVWVRMIRAYCGTEVTTTTRITVCRLGPTTVITASANITTGKARTESNSRSRTLSSQRGP